MECPICSKPLTQTNESALFFNAIRIIQEMREATKNEYPRYIMWENVKGAFSSNKGIDFKQVLEEIAETEIPMPTSGKWAASGMVELPERQLAWRVLDAQFWGVPQRRKRIFLVADFRGQRAGEILFKPESLFGDFEKGKENGKGFPFNFERRIAASSANCSLGWKEGGKGLSTVGRIGFPVSARENDDKLITLSPVIHDDNTNLSVLLFEPRSQDGTPRIHGNIVPTLNTAQGGQRQPCIFESFNYKKEEVSGIDCRSVKEHKELCPTLQAHSKNGFSLNCTHPVRIGKTVRRLTPTECARLMGFPDWWCADIQHSDTAEYRMWGNGISLPCVLYIMENIANTYKDELM